MRYIKSTFWPVIILLDIFAVLVIVYFTMIYPNIPAANASSAKQGVAVEPCEPGSYSIGTEKNGQHICKLEPTGCPYGDSIPVDSPKCVPTTPEEKAVAPAPTPVQKPVTVAPAPAKGSTCNQ